MFKFTVKESGQGVPHGIYNAVFEGIEAAPAKVWNGKELKPGYLFKFKVVDGCHAGAIASRIMGGDGPTTKNSLGRFLSEMTEIPLASGVDFDLHSLLGKPFTIVVKQGENSGTRVETAIPKK